MELPTAPRSRNERSVLGRTDFAQVVRQVRIRSREEIGVTSVSVERTEVVVSIDPGADTGDDARAESALRLREDLVNLDLESVRFAPGARPSPGAKSGETVAWGTLLVAVASSGALTALVNTVNGWIARQRGGTVSVKIGEDELVLTGASSEDQRRVIDDWLERRGAGAAGDG